MIQTKIAILPSYTINNIVPPLTKCLFEKGIGAQIKLGGFQEYNQDLRDAQSWLADFKPDFTLIPLSVRSIIGDVFTLTGTKDTESALDKLRALLDSIDACTHPGTIIITTIESQPYSPLGSRDILAAEGVRALIHKANDEILAFAKSHPNVAVFDFEGFAAQIGSLAMTDEKMWYLGSILLTPAATQEFARQLSALIGARYGATKKCLVLDLDNTLWGGVIGEDGVDGIKLGNSKLGDIYSDVQRTILAYKRCGILLAICSKNNEDDVWPVFEKKEMLLKKDDFAAIRINWNPKSQNIQSIAKELNIGVDSIVFLDDNPAERLEVSTSLPQVSVIDFPQDIARLPAILRGLDYFATAATTKEDLERSRMYLEDKKRKQLESSSSLQDYLLQLQTKITVRRNDQESLPRISQLINKTNQFNLRTQRYTEAEVAALMKSPDSFVLSISVSDRFGDLGLTGVIICSRKGDDRAWFVDSFLLSCRILARDIELQFFNELLVQLPKDAKTLTAEYIPTPKNSQVESFYEKLGFACTRMAGGIKSYTLDVPVARKKIVPLAWITVQ